MAKKQHGNSDLEDHNKYQEKCCEAVLHPQSGSEIATLSHSLYFIFIEIKCFGLGAELRCSDEQVIARVSMTWRHENGVKSHCRSTSRTFSAQIRLPKPCFSHTTYLPPPRRKDFYS